MNIGSSGKMRSIVLTRNIYLLNILNSEHFFDPVIQSLETRYYSKTLNIAHNLIHFPCAMKLQMDILITKSDVADIFKHIPIYI